MATPEEIKAIAGLYVAYFDRAPDPAGLEFWVNQLDNGRDFATISQDFADSPEAKQIYPFLATPEVSGLDPTNLVTSIYQNLFGRDPEAQGLTFWVNVVNSGDVAVGDMVEAIMLGARDAVVDGELVLDKTTVENRIECALEYSTATANLPGFEFDTEAYNIARAVVDSVDATQASVDAAKLTLAEYIAGEGTQSGATFTLCEHTVEVSPEIVETQLVTDTVLYWGFNPHSNDETGVDNTAEPNTNNLTNEGASDGGIPAEDFFNNYFQTIVAANFTELDVIDVDQDTFTVVNFGALEDISISTGDASTGTVTFTYSDGSSDDISLGNAYIDLLRDLIFDEEGNSRFFEKTVAAQVPVYVTPNGAVTLDGTITDAQQIGSVDAVITTTTDAVYATLPPILTPSVNNGGTFEPGFTDQDGQIDNLIVAGTLDLLHGAIIDGGAGYDTLEIDAKGHFAQPKSLVNIEQISIENLPNIYTQNDQDNSSDYPDVQETNGGDSDSIIDLSRARDVENVTITEGLYDDLDASNQSAGTLTVNGLRNDATLTLQGNFSDGDIYVSTSTGASGDGFTVILENVTANNTLYIADNSPTLNLVSSGGGNQMEALEGNNGSFVSTLNISGDAKLFIENDLDSILEDETPVTIDASANTAGVDLNSDAQEQFTIIGSQGDDRFAIDTSDSFDTGQGPDYSDDQVINVTNAVGDNYYDLATRILTLTDGDGDNNVEFDVDVSASITAGDGDNVIQGEGAYAAITLGDGDNRINLDLVDSSSANPVSIDEVETGATIALGDGANHVIIDTDDDNGDGSPIDLQEINITAGDGGNTILLRTLPFGGEDSPSALTHVDVTTGAGDDTLFVAAADATISSGGGNDTITLLGVDDDYVTEVDSLGGGSTDAYNYKGFIPSIYGIEFNIDTGAGSATINLGAYQDNLAEYTGAMVAGEGSSITGNDITLFVNTDADLRAASLNGITAIVMDDDNRAHSGQGYNENIGNPSGAASLTLLDTQVAQLLAEGVDFSTQGETFGAQSVLTIVITGDVTLSDLIDFSTWNDSIRLCFVVEDGATLTMTAEELHNYVAPNGIAVDDSNGFIDNEVIITNAGPNFNAYDDTGGGVGIDGGSVAGSVPMQDVTVLFAEDGFNRPEQTDPVNLIQWNSDTDPLIETTAYPFATDLEITGAADLTVTAPILLGDAFTVDFSAFTGDFTQTVDGVPTLTIANFQAITPDVNDEFPGDIDGNEPNDGDNEVTGVPDSDTWGSLSGNGTSADPVRVNMWVVDGTSTGDSDLGVTQGGIKSEGIQQFVLTAFHDNEFNLLSQSGSHSATIVVCDHTEDLEVLGLQNNRNASVTFEQVNWGTEILLEGDGYANSSDQEKNLGDPDVSEIGKVTANFFEAGANAFVRVTNQGTELGLNEDAEDGFDPDGERTLEAEGIVLNNADRLLLAVEDGDAKINDVSGLDLERIIVTGPEDVEIVVAGITDVAENTVATMMSGLDSSDLVSIDASGVAGTFTMTLTGSADLSGVALSGVDVICLAPGAAATLTMTADQVVAYGASIEAKSGPVTLDVVDMGDQAIDMASLVGPNLVIGTVTFVDEAVTVNAATNFGDATSLVIPEDSEVTMTVAQFGTTTDGTVVDGDTGANADDNKLILTEVPNGEALGTTAVTEVNLTNVSAEVDVDIVFTDFTANAQFDVSSTGGETTTAVINGATDLSAGALGTVDCIVLNDGAELTLSQAQIQTLAGGGALSDVIKLAPGATATLNINEIDGTGTALDLNALVDAWGGALDIGTLTIDNTDGPVSLPGWTTGGADEIVTPTADTGSPEFGTEQTSLTLTMSQFLDLDGIGTITGDAEINLTELANNTDGPDAGLEPDTLTIDTSGITAPKGTATLLEVGVAVTDNGESVTLADTSDLSGFEIILTDGQLFGFATEAQASGATVTENLTVSTNPTGIVWLFDTWSGTAIDTANYSADINTLFVDEDLVNNQNEEAIWTTLASSIVVQKYNDEAPKGLVVFSRTNTFEPFGSALDGITFDDQNEFQTTGEIILNLEGNVTIGDITIADTVGGGAFEGMTISSTYDIENSPADSNVIVQPNIVGDIFFNAPMAANTVLELLLDTSDGQVDVAFADGVNAGGTGPDTDDGMPLITGTIYLGTPAAGVNIAGIDAFGDNSITIGGIDYSDPNLTQVEVYTDGFDFANDLTIGTVNIGDLWTAMGAPGNADPDLYLILNNFTADLLTDLDAGNGTGGDDGIILATDGDVDLSALTGVAGANDLVFDIDGVHGLAAGTITLTADQVAAIGAGDNNADGAADAWILGPGVNPNDITINVTDLSTQILDLDAVRDAGFNIGTITITDSVDLDDGTTLGGADQIVLDIDAGEGELVLELSAEQYNQLANGTIVEDREADADAITDIGTVIIDRVSEIENADGEATIDVTNVNTTGNNTFWITDGQTQTPPNAVNGDAPDNDTTFSAASVLGGFAVTLVDLNTSGDGVDTLGGQTIRFSTEVQADGRDVIVTGADSNAGPDSDAVDSGAPEGDKDQKDTNVVWLFDDITAGSPGLDVSGYSGQLGRLWVSDELVDNEGGDVDGLFTVDDGGTPDFTLDADIIKRIETEDLTALLQLNVPINQRVEITSFTQLGGVEFEVTDPLVSIQNLRIDFGGAVTIGDLNLDNILGPVDPVNTNFPGDDDFDTLTINSVLANNPDHYLLPDNWDPAQNPLPSDDLYNDSFENNVVGDISSGADRGVLRDIIINTGVDDTVDDDDPLVIADEGAAFVAGTIYFSDDGDTTAVGGDAGDPTATLDLNGENDVTVKSLDTSDADITALVIDLVGFSGTFTVTGGSPAFDGDDVDDTTTSLTINGDATAVAQFASTVTTDNDGANDPVEDFVTYTVGAGETLPWAGVSGGALETVTVNSLGTTSLGVISQVNSELFTLTAPNTASQVFACLGEALDDGTPETPSLSATGVWAFIGEGGGDPDFPGANNLDLEIKAVDVAAGGTLTFTDVDLTISGDVDLSGANLTIDGTSTLVVEAGATLTLTVEQVDDLQGNVVITGEGTVVVTGESSTDAETDTTFGEVIQTATMDLPAVTLDAGDTTVEINVFGATGDDGTTRVTQTVIGTANNDAAAIQGGASDADVETLDVILRLGADSGSIGDPKNTDAGPGPDQDNAEAVGDTIANQIGVNIQIDVDAGFDQVDFLSPNNGADPTLHDSVQVAAGAEFYAAGIDTAWVADATTTNDGTAVVEADGSADETIDVSAAGGANGWTLIGADDATDTSTTLIGSDQNDMIVDGAADGGDNAGEEDTHTGNGGEDMFIFNVATTTPAVFAETPIDAAVDAEVIVFDFAGTADDNAALLTVEYQLNNVTTVAVVSDATAPGGAFNFADNAELAAAVADVMNAIPGISASVDAVDDTQVNLVGDNGNLLNINGVTTNAVGGGGAVQALDLTAEETADDTDDEIQVTDAELSGVVTPGEVYFLTVALRDGSEIQAEYTAQGGDGLPEVVLGLMSNGANTGINDLAAGAVVASVSPADGTGATIRITDGEDDDGGFDLTVSEGQAILSASSSSSILPAAGGGGELLADQDADIITDFTEDDDTISFGLAAGDGSNYDEAANEANFADALAAAHDAFANDADLVYYLTGSDDATDGGPVGLLFINANGDDEADSVVALTGVNASNFDDSNIV